MNAVEALAYLLIFIIIPLVFVTLIARYDARERRAAQQPEAVARQARHEVHHG